MYEFCICIHNASYICLVAFSMFTEETGRKDRKVVHGTFHEMGLQQDMYHTVAQFMNALLIIETIWPDFIKIIISRGPNVRDYSKVNEVSMGRCLHCKYPVSCDPSPALGRTRDRDCRYAT